MNQQIGGALLAKGVAWNLVDLYASPQDPQLQGDLAEALRRAKEFAEKYRGKIEVAGGPAAELVAAAVTELESIFEQADKPAIYAGLLHAADARPPEHGALVAKTQEMGSEIRNELLFFELEWIALDDASAETVIQHPVCRHYRHYLSSMRRYKPHTLSEPEEKLLEETANTGRRAFNRLFDEMLSAMTFEVRIEGTVERMNESGVLALLHDSRREVRRSGAKALTEKLHEYALPLTFIFNNTAQDHAMTDRLRRFPDPMAARHLANEIEPETVAALMEACDSNRGIVADYYRLKSRLLGIGELYDYDRYAPIGADGAKMSWDEARQLVLESYGEFSPRMREVAERFFDERWIDAEVRDGKRGGAFSASTVPSSHPYVLLSYLGSPRDVMTIAHELGHGVHQYLARDRGYLQSNTALTMAETASVFGEALVFERLRSRESDPRVALALLCEFLEEALATVFRQVTLTRFEQRLHRVRRDEGELSSDRMCDIWLDVNRGMYGDAVTLTDDYRWWWAYIPHFIHTPFYCYAYSFGELLVLALYELYRERGSSFVPQYLDLLAAGGSEAPSDLLARLGIDLRDEAFWSRGLGVLKRLLADAQKLAGDVQRA